MSSTTLAPAPSPPDLDTLMLHLSEVCLLIDEEGRCQWASANSARLLGRPPEAIRGTLLSQLVHRTDAAALLAPTDGASVQVRLAHGFLPEPWVDLRMVTVPSGTLCLLRDASAVRGLQQTVSRATQEDPLTGLANRAHTLRILRTELARAHRYERPLAVILIDIDGLRRINHHHGTAGGDVVLELTARCLDGCIRGMDHVGRTDADEFLVLLPETQEEGATLLAERVRSAMEALAVRLPRGMVRPTVTAGVAVVADDDEVETLIERAARAILQVKLTGGNRVGVARTSPA